MTFRILSHTNGTATLVDEMNGQAMHSRIGPELEANVVYATPARVDDFLRDKSAVHVLYDVGMGTGANVAATLVRIRGTEGTSGRLEIFSFEAKPDGLRMALEKIENFPTLIPWRAYLGELLEKGVAKFFLGAVEVHWRLVTGDFYERMAEAPAPDTLYFDFYSPKVVPELWSLDRFLTLRRKCGDRPVRLFTYSAATPVRLHLLSAGFFVGTGPSTGVKSETTIAATRPELLEFPLKRDWLRKLDHSTSVSGEAFGAMKRSVIHHPQFTA